eukprot:10800600-Lingulodinium_polyedra.AAC.1
MPPAVRLPEGRQPGSAGGGGRGARANRPFCPRSQKEFSEVPMGPLRRPWVVCGRQRWGLGMPARARV